METTKRRYVGIDLGKREYTLAIIGRNGTMSIHQGKTSDHGWQALYRLLEKTDKVALEAGNMAFIMAYQHVTYTTRPPAVLNTPLMGKKSYFSGFDRLSY